MSELAAEDVESADELCVLSSGFGKSNNGLTRQLSATRRSSW